MHARRVSALSSPLATAATVVVFAAVAAAAPPPFTATEMMKLERLADLQLSPDGTQVAYALTEIDLPGQKRNAELWLAPVAGGEPRRLTTNPASDTRPRFSPDGRSLAFLSTRDGSPQVWQLELAGGEAKKLTSLSTGVDAFEWLGGTRLALVSEVFPSCGADDACNAKALAGVGKPSTARAYDELLYRHWDAWDDGRRSHVLAFTIETGALVDLTPGGDDAPPFSLGGEDWFNLGDRDLAVHVLRTSWLDAGLALDAVSARLYGALGIRHRAWPMSNDAVATRVVSDRGSYASKRTALEKAGVTVLDTPSQVGEALKAKIGQRVSA